MTMMTATMMSLLEPLCSRRNRWHRCLYFLVILYVTAEAPKATAKAKAKAKAAADDDDDSDEEPVGAFVQ